MEEEKDNSVYVEFTCDEKDNKSILKFHRSLISPNAVITVELLDEDGTTKENDEGEYEMSVTMLSVEEVVALRDACNEFLKDNEIDTQ